MIIDIGPDGPHSRLATFTTSRIGEVLARLPLTQDPFEVGTIFAEAKALLTRLESLIAALNDHQFQALLFGDPNAFAQVQARPQARKPQGPEAQEQPRLQEDGRQG